MGPQPLIELGLDEELEEPAWDQTDEGDDHATTPHTLGDERLTQTVAVRH